VGDWGGGGAGWRVEGGRGRRDVQHRLDGAVDP
jgi:hypothetical protein